MVETATVTPKGWKNWPGMPPMKATGMKTATTVAVVDRVDATVEAAAAAVVGVAMGDEAATISGEVAAAAEAVTTNKKRNPSNPNNRARVPLPRPRREKEMAITGGDGIATGDGIKTAKVATGAMVAIPIPLQRTR